MPAILIKIWGFLSTKVAEYIGIALAVLGTYAAIKKSGENVVKLAETEQTLKAVEVKNDVEISVNAASDSELDKRLSEFYRD